MNYIGIYRENFRSLRRLGPLRAGQVLYALMDYMDGNPAPDDLSESQLILLDTMIDKLDRDAAAYSKRCEQNRKNISVRWNKHDTNVCDTSTKHTTAQDGIQPYTDVSTTPHHTEPNQTTPHPTTPTPQPQQPDPHRPLMTPEEAEEISSVQDSCLQAARDAGFEVDKPAVVRSLCDLTAEYGQEAMQKAIAACLDNGVAKLAYLKKTLSNMRDNVPKPVAPIGTARGPRVLRDQQYEQREYENTPGLPDWMREGLAKQGVIVQT